MSRSIVIGDVHGCLGELDDLVRAVDPGPGDRLFFLGDIVDRGPDSVGVIRRVAQLIARFPGSVCVAGNHEEKSLRNRESGREPRAWWADATEADWAFLDALPLFHRLPGVLLVHGGLFPAYFAMYSCLGEPSPTWRRDRDKRADRASRFLRVRQVSPSGHMVALGEKVEGAVHWTETYDGREGFCFFGHDPQVDPPEVLRAGFAMGLDTGCCFGGRLTAAVFTDRPAEPSIISVRARQQYAEQRAVH